MDSLLRQSRSRIVTITRWGVFLFGVWNGGRAIVLVGQSAALSQLDGNLVFLSLRAATAVFWSYLFFFEWVALWRKRPFTRLAIPLTITLYGLYELLLLLFFATAINMPLLTLALLGYTLTISLAAWSLGAQASVPS